MTTLRMRPEWELMLAAEAEWRRHWARYDALGFTATEKEHISKLSGLLTHPMRDRRGLRPETAEVLPWDELKRRYAALEPPYIGLVRPRGGRGGHKPLKRRLYVEQRGLCAYCGKTLAPLDAPYFVERATRFESKINLDNGINLEHRVPLARGGTTAVENLVLACYDCNYRKGVRTDAEFLRYPDDPVSLMGPGPIVIAEMLDFEARGYDGFGVPW
jgi:5-methylcytosine-specific restriction endonuclease McrA